MNVNKTFILFVNRLLNKVNITVIEGGKHPSKCPQRPCAYDAKTPGRKGRNVLGIRLFCLTDAKHMDRVMGSERPRDCARGGCSSRIWCCWTTAAEHGASIHLLGLGRDNS